MRHVSLKLTSDCTIECSSILGVGQMGVTVYKGVYERQDCIVKVAKKALSREEAVYRKLLESPRDWFFQLFDYGPVMNTSDYALVLNYIPGVDLHQLTKGKFLIDREIAMITLDLCNALEHLKKIHVMHGDLKRSNVVIDNATKCAMLIDFGNAQDLADEGLCKSVTCNIPHRCPASFLDIAHGAEADVWALGILIEELVTDGHLLLIRELPVYNRELRVAAVQKQFAHIGQPAPAKMRKSRFFPHDNLWLTLRRPDRAREFPIKYRKARGLADNSSWQESVYALLRKVDLFGALPKEQTTLGALADLVDRCLLWEPEPIEKIIRAFRNNLIAARESA